MRQGAVYRISCIKCKVEGKKESVYSQETVWTLFDWGLEHIRTIDRLNEESSMVEHSMEPNPGAPLEFKM